MMPSPTKPHFVVDAAFYSSKEVLSIPRRYRLQAIGAWTAAGSWSVDHQTDGWLPGNALRELGITPLIVDLLVEATLWEIPSADGHAAVARRLRDVHATAAQFRNWPKWQKTKAEWEAGRAANARRQARLRKSRSADDDADASRPGNALPPTAALAAGNIDDMTRNALRGAKGSKEELKNLGKGLSQEPQADGDATLPAFPDHCPKHRHDPDPPPCGACRQTREQNAAARDRAESVEAVMRTDRVQREKQRRADCWDCDDMGQIEVYDERGESIGVRNCKHPDVP